jgi:hypothetical protein
MEMLRCTLSSSHTQKWDGCHAIPSIPEWIGTAYLFSGRTNSDL